jgi:hypothetical protein
MTTIERSSIISEAALAVAHAGAVGGLDYDAIAPLAERAFDALLAPSVSGHK